MEKKIVFMGTPKFSVQTLEILAKSNFEIACVYTQPPKKSDRGQKINSSPVSLAAEKLNLKIRTPSSLEDEKEYNYFKSIGPYIVIVVAYGKIIPKNYLSIPEKGFLNIHASLLPKWRGAAPIQRSIMNRDKETGISYMKIEEGLDTGPFINQIKVRIDNQTTARSLSNELSKIGAENIIKTINLIESEKEKFVRQDNTQAIYAKKINKKESKIIWNEKANYIIAKINSLNPNPGAWFELNGSRYKIWKALISELQGVPGTILDEKLIIACKDKSIKVIEIQKEGKNKIEIEDFLKGNKMTKGKKVS